jgi:hypothetical protein
MHASSRLGGEHYDLVVGDGKLYRSIVASFEY